MRGFGFWGTEKIEGKRESSRQRQRGEQRLLWQWMLWPLTSEMPLYSFMLTSSNKPFVIVRFTCVPVFVSRFCHFCAVNTYL